MIKDRTIENFINELKLATPIPSGGSVASLSSAQGVALIMMVSNLTLNNDKYIEWHELCQDTLNKCEALLKILLNGIDDDASEFLKVVDAYRLPHTTDNEEKQRSLAISYASINAAEVPMRVMEASLDALNLVLNIIDNSNPNLLSDLYIAARSLHTGLLSAKYNVDANIGSMKKVNLELADEYTDKTETIVDKANLLIEKIFN